MAVKVSLPIVLGVRMSDYGYWIASVNVAPGRTLSVMLCSTGITRERAEADALLTLTGQLRGITE